MRNNLFLTFGLLAPLSVYACTAEEDLGNHPGDDAANPDAEVASDAGSDTTDVSDAAMDTSVPKKDAAPKVLSVWTRLAPMPTKRQLASAVFGSDGRLFVLGGISESAGTIGSVEVYDTTLDAWTKTQSLQTPRYGMSVARANDGKIYAIGGFASNSLPEATKVVEIYDPILKTWSFGPSLPTGRYYAQAVTLKNGDIALLGGIDNGKKAATDEVLTLTPGAPAWVVSPDSMLATRSAFVAVSAPDGAIYVIGSPNNSAQGTSETRPASGGSWFSMSHLAADVTKRVGAWGADGLVHVMGGVGYDGHFGYSPTLKSWTTLKSLPGERFSASAASDATGKIYIVGGAADGANQSDDLLRWDP